MSLGPTEEIVLKNGEAPEASPSRSVVHKPAKRVKRRQSTTHLKAVPETLEQREALKRAAEAFSESLDKTRSLSKNELEAHGRSLLEQQNQPEKFLGFIMVLIGNFFLAAAVSRDALRTPIVASAALSEACRGMPSRI